MKRVLISAAEPSGDRLAAEVLAALQAHGQFQAAGLAGPALRAAGVEVVAPTEDVSVMGLIEVLRHLGRVQGAKRRLEAAVDGGSWDAVVTVDAPDLHLPLAARARARGIPVVGLVSPQVWAWRRGRVGTIAERYDRLCCLFDFEPALYANLRPGFQAVWTGHPVVDRLPRRDGFDPDRFALVPGSRRQERERLLAPFLHAAAAVRALRPAARFLLPSPDPVPGLPDWVQVVPGVADLASCRGALTKSGTVTLELAVLGVPMVVAHRVHPLTYWLGRMLVHGVHHVAMPNVLADRAAGAKAPDVVPEYLQHWAPGELAAALLALPETQPVDLRGLGDGGAAARMAEVVAGLW